jgi:hypothetical protein
MPGAGSALTYNTGFGSESSLKPVWIPNADENYKVQGTGFSPSLHTYLVRYRCYYKLLKVVVRYLHYGWYLQYHYVGTYPFLCTVLFSNVQHPIFVCIYFTSSQFFVTFRSQNNASKMFFFYSSRTVKYGYFQHRIYIRYIWDRLRRLCFNIFSFYVSAIRCPR